MHLYWLKLSLESYLEADWLEDQQKINSKEKMRILTLSKEAKKFSSVLLF